MVLDTLHQHILQMEWSEVEATLSTDVGKDMARDYFKEDLPLHMAVERKAPDSTVLALLEAFPDAAVEAGRLGGTPLHLAAQQKLSHSVLVALIRACPEVLDQEDDNRRLPNDYLQRTEPCREALARPSACWIEDMEKEEYMEKIELKTTQLRQKITLLRGALESSAGHRETLQSYLQQLEPRLENERNALETFSKLDNHMKDFHDSNHSQIEKLRAKIKVLSDDLSIEPGDDETIRRSHMRRTYMERVQRNFEKMMTRTDQIRREIQKLSILTGYDQNGRDGDSD